MNLNEFESKEDQYQNYYSQVLPVCLKCSLFSEVDETCIIEEKNIIDIVKDQLIVVMIDYMHSSHKFVYLKNLELDKTLYINIYIKKLLLVNIYY